MSVKRYLSTSMVMEVTMHRDNGECDESVIESSTPKLVKIAVRKIFTEETL